MIKLATVSQATKDLPFITFVPEEYDGVRARKIESGPLEHCSTVPTAEPAVEPVCF